MLEEIDHEKALVTEIEGASDEDKAIMAEGLGKTTAADRQWIRDEVAEGRITPANAARRFGVTPQYVGKLLKKAGIKFASRKMEREAREKAELEAKERAVKSSFAERKAAFAEEHKMSAISQFRSAFLLEGLRQKKWREAATASAGATMPSPKEAAMAARTMAVIDQRIRILLDLDTTIDERELPSIEINDMGDEEIAAVRRGPVNEDTLVKLDDDIVEETA